MILRKHIYNATMSCHQRQIFVKNLTEELEIDAIAKLSQLSNLFLKQDIHFHSNLQQC